MIVVFMTLNAMVLLKNIYTTPPSLRATQVVVHPKIIQGVIQQCCIVSGLPLLSWPCQPCSEGVPAFLWGESRDRPLRKKTKVCHDCCVSPVLAWTLNLQPRRCGFSCKYIFGVSSCCGKSWNPLPGWPFLRWDPYLPLTCLPFCILPRQWSTHPSCVLLCKPSNTL